MDGELPQPLELVRQMQEQLANAQARLAETTVDGTVAGGAVTVTVNGIGELQGVDILEENESGRIERFTVMIRPLSGLQVLAEAVAAKLEAG